jgi:uncharacterized SAM-binding protein YcdF (DUF218 family)
VHATRPRRLGAVRRVVTNVVARPLEPWVLRPGRRWQPTTADCVIVPGAAVSGDGTPSEFLRARVANAIALHRQGLASRIVFTGGPRRGGPPEAEVAHALALAAGLPAADLHVESRSRNTLENLRYAGDLMASAGWTTCLISTDPVHMRRCLWMARDLGLRAHAAPAFESPSYADRRIRRWFVVYEFRALLRYGLGRVPAAVRKRGR